MSVFIIFVIIFLPAGLYRQYLRKVTAQIHLLRPPHSAQMGQGFSPHLHHLLPLPGAFRPHSNFNNSSFGGSRRSGGSSLAASQQRAAVVAVDSPAEAVPAAAAWTRLQAAADAAQAAAEDADNTN